jgi:hypothetical protein
MTALKWTHKSTRKLCAALRRRGIAVSRKTVGRLLHQHDYSLRTNRKRLAGTHHPDRDRQFRYLTRIRRWYLTHGLPVISVDTKKETRTNRGLTFGPGFGYAGPDHGR